MTWTAFHNRGEVLRAVMATAEERQDGILPMDVPGVAEKFHDELDLLGALQLKWHTRLAGHAEKEFGPQPLDLRLAITTAWARTAEENSGLRKVLDHYRDEPIDEAMARAMRKATAKEHHFLAVMAGLAGLGLGHPEVEKLGAQIEDQARALEHGVPALQPMIPAEMPQPRGSLLERIRAVVAA